MNLELVLAGIIRQDELDEFESMAVAFLKNLKIPWSYTQRRIEYIVQGLLQEGNVSVSADKRLN